MLMASMLAMVLLAASPVMAQDGGDASDDSIGGAGGDVSSSEYNTQVSAQFCQNIIGDISVDNDNDATQYAGDDVGVNAAEGDGNAQALSQDEAQAIAQENNTTINIVQQCFQQAQQAQGDNNVQDQDGTQTGVIGDNNDDGVADDDDVVIGPAADDFNGDGAVDAGDDMNGDGVVGAADAQASAFAEAGDAAASAEGGDAAASAEGGDAVASAGSDDAEAGAVAVLPDTGGASLFTLAAGALLVAGGLLARRIVR